MKSIAVQTQDDGHPAQTPTPSLPTLHAPDLRSAFVENITNRGIHLEADSYVARLTFLGQEIINFCVAATLFENRDISTPGDLQKWRRIYTGSHTLSQWSSLYHHSEAYPIDIVSEKPARLAELFAAYVGVIYQQDGMGTIQSWIDALIRSSVGKMDLAATYEDTSCTAKRERASSSSDHVGNNEISPHSPKRPRLQPDDSFQNSRPGSPSKSAPASEQTLFLTLSAPAPAPASTHIPGLPSLSGLAAPSGQSLISIMHERAAKKGLKPSWSFSQNGTPHDPKWHANLSIPEVGLVALGIHRTKQGAKEEAARSAVTGPNALL
ncbi:hypothetical protein FRB93_010186 [Tulasnella sp. JGI-2019a]|nr:hypothetical protein FRB93_010186 [Tulasnella sp. JGI-2019a]